MSLTIEDVLYVSELARLEFEREQVKVFTEQLADMLDYANKLSELDTTGVAPTAHVLPLQNVLREDKCEESLPREEVLKNAPSEENGCFKVPKVIE